RRMVSHTPMSSSFIIPRKAVLAGAIPSFTAIGQFELRPRAHVDSWKNHVHWEISDMLLSCGSIVSVGS
ncbi:hypothetical protein, partial [Bradyrhizobium centrolobii]|uniref:hypothetical protein n=1 Tax=Bradyrhizobium centrolobii TaxID=1505087 RepID=UPI001AEC9729